MRKFIDMITESSSYMREIPRDLFNEGDLLTNMGKLVINLERVSGDFQLDWDRGPFVVAQDQGDGSTYVANMSLTVRGTKVLLLRPINSREKWPLLLIEEEDWNEIEVFDRSGNFTPEMVAYLEGSDA